MKLYAAFCLMSSLFFTTGKAMNSLIESKKCDWRILYKYGRPPRKKVRTLTNKEIVENKWLGKEWMLFAICEPEIKKLLEKQQSK